MEHTCTINKNVQLMPTDIKQSMLYDNLIHAVYIHRRAIDSANILTNSFSMFYIVLLVCSVAYSSLSFCNVINAVTSWEKLDVFINSVVILIQLYWIFLGNYVGQNIIDSSTAMSQATYNAHWYAAPLCMQKLIPLIIQRSNKHSVLTIGVLFDASLEGFATLLSMCISYVMVLQSMGTHTESEKK
ncbi:PREDICTED: odorant receptor 85b-like [Vollenhovia emeryi]|uniref:odorant receptor 85b-like n=1 Tax=Vollenhovia emeryi TaxID=411798 RepID=UPI0005F48305|nr:PREDICTED: odorant receptor 85b-like [Vollenhovia emeryi]